jgi:hypothetical protein
VILIISFTGSLAATSGEERSGTEVPLQSEVPAIPGFNPGLLLIPTPGPATIKSGVLFPTTGNRQPVLSFGGLLVFQ